MLGRTLVSAAFALVFAFAFASEATGKNPPPSSGGGSTSTAPTNLRITGSSTYGISLAWDAAKGGSSTWWYCVQVDGAGCYRVDPPATTFTRSGLMPGRTTTWTVIVVNANGNRSAPSNAVTFTTPPDTTPPSPAPSLSPVAVYPTRISVTWTASKDDTSQVSYTLWYDGVPQSSATILHVAPETAHQLRVTASDAFGNTASSNVLSVTTPGVTDTLAPTAPTNVTLGPESTSPEAWLSWTQSTDDSDPQSLILYEIYFDGVINPVNDGNIGYPAAVAYCPPDASGPMTIVVRAVDTSGNSSGPSNEVHFTC